MNCKKIYKEYVFSMYWADIKVDNLYFLGMIYAQEA